MLKLLLLSTICFFILFEVTAQNNYNEVTLAGTYEKASEKRYQHGNCGCKKLMENIMIPLPGTSNRISAILKER